ncbi:thiol:disulfide interchange protein DsbA/DsbL [Tahibacter amnicola]|uniref:Thiol:disulfide interchange protein n=1 Tax=Tahibacter amnicola TaxID=2976241 RepID=A0ABY6BEI1_9GAMM|nr:thiol:disulfide interchange protein DsbA/DsbL [Tahibacter amnicola]UXI68205.1 thiol:disulfide interchange protein DsbA/DsbL [Tahibacter amnicola]
MLKRVFVLLMGLVTVTACGAAEEKAAAKTDWKAETHYFVIDPPVATTSGAKVEVVEVFSYACPHCAHFQQQADEIKAKLPKDAQFSYIPAIFNPSWVPYARAYYAAESLGILDKTHQALFDALHRDRKPMASMEDIAQFYGQLGADPKAVLATADSFVVEGRITKDQERVRQYKIDGTPSIVVNGKYRVTAAAAGGYAEMVELVLWLVDKELAARKGGK